MAKLKPPVSDQDQQTGNRTATVTLVEYGDYQCPHCGHAHPLLKKLLQNKGDDVHFVFRNFPLAEIHPAAMMAAQAAEAAGKQGKFWEMHDLIYEHQADLHGNAFLDFAQTLQLNMQTFAQDWKSEAVLAKIEQDFESGMRSGVNGTPTFFINGAKFDSYDGTYESLEEGVQIFSQQTSAK